MANSILKPEDQLPKNPNTPTSIGAIKAFNPVIQNSNKLGNSSNYPNATRKSGNTFKGKPGAAPKRKK